MALSLFAQNLKSSLDLKSIDRYFAQSRDLTLQVLQQVRPEGMVAGGRFKLASVSGGAGQSTDYNLENHKWGDWSAGGAGQRGTGLVSFVSTTLRCSSAQAVQFLMDGKFLDKTLAKKSLSDADGNPLVLPIPEDKRSWEYVLEQDVLRKDRGILSHVWTYLDTDGSLLGYKYRVDQRSTSKEVYTLTFRAETEWTKQAWQKKVVPAYGLEQLSQGPNVRVLFVEGEKAADAARAMLAPRWKVLAYNGVSGVTDIWLPDDQFWEDVEVVIWPDNDSAGRDAARKLQMILENMQNSPREIRIARVEAIPGLPPKWDLADWTEDCPVDVAVELERAELVDSFERVCREWVYVTQPDMFYNLVDRGLVWTTSSFDKRFSRYSDKTGSASKKFLSALETLKVDDLEFLPGGETFVTTGAGKTFLNEWYPSATYAEATRIAKDLSITDEEISHNARHFIAHLKRIAGDQTVEPELIPGTQEPVPGTEDRELWDAIAYYFSRLVNRPMDKQGWVPIFLSEINGSGKSYFLALMRAILGGNRCAELNVATYIGQYEDWKDGCLFYELAEVHYHESTAAYEEVKKNHNNKPFDFESSTDRTAGSRKLNIKTRGMKNQRDFLNGYITSNKLYPMALSSGGESGEAGDRRLFVVRCEQKLTTEEQVQLFDEEIAHRAHWVGAWLMRFKPKYVWDHSWAPITEHKRVMLQKDRERSENRQDKYEVGKYEKFYSVIRWAKSDKIGAFARKVISSEAIRELCEARRTDYPYDEARFDKILLKAGLLKGPTVRVEGSIKRLYAIDPEMEGKPDSVWKTELQTRLDDAGI